MADAKVILGKAEGMAQSALLLFVRMYWGWQFAETGWGKIHNLGKVTEFFASLHIPFPGLNAHFVAGLEAAGGILLALGLLSRPIAFLLCVNMLVAYLAADREALLSIFSDPDKFTAATPYTFLFASMIVLTFGPGKAAVDAWITVNRKRNGDPTGCYK